MAWDVPLNVHSLSLLGLPAFRYVNAACSVLRCRVEATGLSDSLKIQQQARGEVEGIDYMEFLVSHHDYRVIFNSRSICSRGESRIEGV